MTMTASEQAALLPDAVRGVGDARDRENWEADLERSRVQGWASANIPKLAAALALLRAYHASDEAELEFWLWWWAEVLRAERRDFMKNEVLGRTYPVWQAMPHLIVYRVACALGNRDLALASVDWLKTFTALATLAAGRGPGRQIVDHRIEDADADRAAPIFGTGPLVGYYEPFIAWSGDRTDSRDWHDGKRWVGLDASVVSPWVTWAGDIRNRTRDTSWHLHGRLCAALDEVFPNERPHALSPDEAEAVRRAVVDDSLAHQVAVAGWLGSFLPSVPARIVRTERGVWSLSPIGRGSSTAHSYACAHWNDGTIGYLFADLGFRGTSENDYVRPGSAWIVQRGDAVIAVAQRDDGKYGGPVEMELPGGAILLDVSIGPEGVGVRNAIGSRIDLPPTPAEPESPPTGEPQPAPPVGTQATKADYHKTTDLLVNVAEPLIDRLTCSDAGILDDDERGFLISVLEHLRATLEARHPLP